MIDQSDFEIGGLVSVWVGNFAGDVQFDDYMNLSKQFERDFGFTIDDRGIRECVVEAAPTPIRDLVRGFSSWESFAPAVAEAARGLGIESATTMIVFYCVQFEPSKVTVDSDAPLKFLGAFSFS
jgi:hypothetical protein